MMKDKDWVFKLLLTINIGLVSWNLIETIDNGKITSKHEVQLIDQNRRIDQGDRRNDHQDEQLSLIINHFFVRPEDVNPKDEKR